MTITDSKTKEKFVLFLVLWIICIIGEDLNDTKWINSSTRSTNDFPPID
jgi:hypothetical protein